jgi:hypothetical protein
VLSAAGIGAILSPPTLGAAAFIYYELEGRRAVSGPLWRLEPAAGPALASLPLVATDVGRRTLVVGDRQVPLFAAGGARPTWSSPSAADRGDQPGSSARQWTVPLTGGSAAVPISSCSWVAPGWIGSSRLAAPTPTRSPLTL